MIDYVPKMLTLAALLILAFIAPEVNSNELKAKEGQSHNRRCFVCYSCKRVERSQSLECPENEQQCMVRYTSYSCVPI